jgi:hypothetical protein
MVITEHAAALLAQVQNQRALPHAPKIEVEPGKDNFTMVMTEPGVDDEVLYHGETPVLYISAPAAKLLEDCLLTTRDTGQGIALTVASREN